MILISSKCHLSLESVAIFFPFIKRVGERGIYSKIEWVKKSINFKLVHKVIQKNFNINWPVHWQCDFAVVVLAQFHQQTDKPAVILQRPNVQHPVN